VVLQSNQSRVVKRLGRVEAERQLRQHRAAPSRRR
jgi:hypothetical protein